jgi:hypothetical protein
MAITLANTTNNNSSSTLASPASVTVAPSPTAGNLLVATIFYKLFSSSTGIAEPVRLVSDNVGGTWVELVHNYDDGTSLRGGGTSVWYCLNALGGATTVTGKLTLATQSYNMIFTVEEFSAGAGTWATDGSNSAHQVANTTHYLAGSFTPAHNGDLVIGAMVANQSNLVVGNTITVGTALAFAFDFSCAFEWHTQTTAAAINVDFTVSGGSPGGSSGICCGGAFTFTASAATKPHMLMTLGVY